MGLNLVLISELPGKQVLVLYTAKPTFPACMPLPGCAKLIRAARVVGRVNLYQTLFLLRPATMIEGANVSPVCRVASVKSMLVPVKIPKPKPPFEIAIGMAAAQPSFGGTAA